jgi:hypothetical protein
LKSFCSGGEYMVQLLWVKIESRVKKNNNVWFLGWKEQIYFSFECY